MTSLTAREIDISIAPPFQQVLAERWLEAVARRALETALPPDEPGQLSLVVTDDETIRGLNRRYRGLDEATDVLSFSTTHPGHWEGEEGPPGISTQEQPDEPFIFPQGEVPPLGEVILSYPQALRQAQGRNEPVAHEVALLIVHGVLHLVGYDHLDAEDTAIMKAKEQAALEALFPGGQEQS